MKNQALRNLVFNTGTFLLMIECCESRLKTVEMKKSPVSSILVSSRVTKKLAMRQGKNFPVHISSQMDNNSFYC